MMHREKYVLLCVMLFMLLPMRQISAAPAEPVSDVRVLIDVSGSMKKNDPKNLRAPALRMLVGLMPDDAQSGVWTFAKYVNMLVPLRGVNDAWKLEAERQSKQIHSYGLFTNIEQALNKATANQKTADSRYRRSVILLSDGLVDMSTDIEQSKKSRQRIIDTILPRLKKAHVAVHTIALSSSADHELLRAISIATDGWYEQVDNAEQLQRVFLHLFEKAAKRDTVPLDDNHFKIDDSVTEMTLLIFRREGSKPTELVLPDQSRIKHIDLPGNTRWHHEDNYDLITIDQPPSGAWKIDAELDPDNRVMVVTDLKLKTTDLPNNILIGEVFDFDASLTEKGETIIRQDFLKLVDSQIVEESEVADPIKRSLNETQQKGRYLANVGESFHPGRNDVVVTMTSATFERQRRQSINVVDMPFDIQMEQLMDQQTRSHRMTLKPDTDLIKTDKLIIAAMLTAEDGSEWSYDVMKSGDNEWQLTLADLQPAEEYTVALQIRTETLKGRNVFLQPTPIVLKDRDQVTKVEEQMEMATEEDEGSQDTEQQIEVNELVDAEEVISGLETELTLPIIEDEMAEDLTQLLPEVDDEPLAVTEADVMDQQGGMAPATKLAIGNTVILLFAIAGLFLWRRQSAATTKLGEEL